MKTLTTLVLATAALFVALPGAPAQEGVLRPNDRINLKISGVPTTDQSLVSGIYTISEAGTLNLPHLNSTPVRAAGVERSALEKAIEAAYRQAEIYTNPTITINIDADSVTTRFVTVSGEVKGNGQVPYRDNMTIFEAISAAGGPTDFASMKSVGLIRNGKTTVHDLGKIRSNPAVNIKLQPGDTIHVRPRGILGN
jgi:polysaccharide export outer membrane protein